MSNPYDPTQDAALQSLASGGLPPATVQALNASYPPPNASLASTPSPAAIPPWPSAQALGAPTGPAPAPAPPPAQPAAPPPPINLAPSTMPPLAAPAPPKFDTPQQAAAELQKADAQKGLSYLASGGKAPPTPAQPLAIPTSAGSPGGFSPSSETIHTEQGVQASPETIAARDRAIAADAEARDATEAYAHVQKVQADRGAVQDQINALRERMAAQRAESEVAPARQALDDARKEAADAQAAGVDPNHLWKNKSAGSKISAILALVAGGMVQGLRGGNNPALEAIQKEIDDDLEAQRTNIQAKGEAVKTKQAAYDLVQAKGLDDVQKAHAAAVLANDALMKQISAEMSSPDATPEGRVQLAQLQQQIAEKQSASLLAFDEHTKNKVTTSEAETYHPPLGAGAASSALEQKIGAETSKVLLQYPGTSTADARRLATLAVTGKDVAPGQTESGLSKGAAGAGVGTRGARVLANIDAAKDALDKVNAIMDKGDYSPAAQQTVRTLLATAKENGAVGIPDDAIGVTPLHPLGSAAHGIALLSGSTRAAVNTAIEQLKKKRADYAAMATGGGGEDAAETP